MATGDQPDMLARIKGLLPRWFNQGQTPTPVLDALLTGPAWAFSFIYGIAEYANRQVRIATASDGWLDLLSGDFFGPKLPRRPGQSDASYRALIIAGIMRERATRRALRQVLLDVTGREPLIMEGRRIGDGVTYNGRGGYNTGRAYGTIRQPYTTFVEAYRPLAGSQWDGVTDADIYAAANSIRPVNAKIYLRIIDTSPLPVMSVVALALVGGEDVGPGVPVLSVSVPAGSVSEGT